MPRILIIDDDPTVRLSTELVLGALGFETASSEDGLAGLARMREQPPDLVVCDILMPGLDGFGVLAAAQQEPRLARVPFIFLTSLAERQDRRRGMTAGADDYLTKPFHPTELVDAIQARFRKVAAQGPDEAAMQAALARIRSLLSGPEQAQLGLAPADPEPQDSVPAGAEDGDRTRRARTAHWAERVRRCFDENNPRAILYLQDQVLSKKQTIHATCLLAQLYLRMGDRTRAEAEFAVAESVMRLNIQLFRQAFAEESAPWTTVAKRGLRSRLLRLEGKLEAIRKQQLS